MSEEINFGNLVSELARTHVELWHQEDKARSPSGSEVVQAKRKIDKLNQKRNDLIEKIDEFTVETVKKYRKRRHSRPRLKHSGVNSSGNPGRMSPDGRHDASD